MASITFNGVYPLLYSYPTVYASYPPASYLNIYPNTIAGGFLRGANLIVSGGAAVLLTTAQLQQFAGTIRMHLSTGSINQTINGVQVVSSGTTSINITVSGNTINVPNNDAALIASAVLRYTVTGAPPQQTGGSMPYYDLNA